jgi:hypothetical protein
MSSHTNTVSQNILNGSFNDIIFNHSFAQAIGYTLADLGAWCDEGENPLQYVLQFLD